ILRPARPFDVGALAQPLGLVEPPPQVVIADMGLDVVAAVAHSSVSTRAAAAGKRKLFLPQGPMPRRHTRMRAAPGSRPGSATKRKHRESGIRGSAPHPHPLPPRAGRGGATIARAVPTPLDT